MYPNGKLFQTMVLENEGRDSSLPPTSFCQVINIKLLIMAKGLGLCASC